MNDFIFLNILTVGLDYDRNFLRTQKSIQNLAVNNKGKLLINWFIILKNYSKNELFIDNENIIINLINKKDNGIYEAMNLLLAASRNKEGRCVFINSGDMILGDAFKLLLLDQNQTLLAGDCEVVDEKGKFCWEFSSHAKHSGQKFGLAFGMPFNHGALFFKNSENIKYYKNTFNLSSLDYLWILENWGGLPKKEICINNNYLVHRFYLGGKSSSLSYLERYIEEIICVFKSDLRFITKFSSILFRIIKFSLRFFKK